MIEIGILAVCLALSYIFADGVGKIMDNLFRK